jgi:excisionase family DNA binding protein
MTSDLLDVEEAAAFLHVRVSTVRAWVLKSKIGYVKLGRRVFLRRQDLQDMIERSFVQPGSAKQNAN